MRIAIIFEGETEKAFLPFLRQFLLTRLPGRMPKLDPVPQKGRVPTHAKLKLLVEDLLSDRKQPADAVIALTDVYTGSYPLEFTDAADAKAKMRAWVGAEPRFFPHAAQHDFEAWLLPYWSAIQKMAGSNRTAPGLHPERINHGNPPAHRLKDTFRTGTAKKCYSKVLMAQRILTGQDLLIAANQCPELKAFLNTILQLCGGGLVD